jgi:hypothetical protein
MNCQDAVDARDAKIGMFEPPRRKGAKRISGDALCFIPLLSDKPCSAKAHGPL